MNSERRIRCSIEHDEQGNRTLIDISITSIGSNINLFDYWVKEGTYFFGSSNFLWKNSWHMLNRLFIQTKIMFVFVSSEGNQLSSRAQCKKLIFGAQTCASDFHSRGNESTQHWKSSSLSHFRLALDCWVLKWKESFIIDTATFVHFCVTIWWASTKYSIDLYMWASISNFPRRDRLNILGWLASWDLRT